jgi:hypothetical protein
VLLPAIKEQSNIRQIIFYETAEGPLLISFIYKETVEKEKERNKKKTEQG